MREGAGASGGEAQHLKAVRQRTGMAALAAIFDVVMDRVVVGRDGLEGRKIGLRDGAARDVEALAERKILEKPAFRKAVPPPVKCFALSHLSLSRALFIIAYLDTPIFVDTLSGRQLGRGKAPTNAGRARTRFRRTRAGARGKKAIHP